MSFKVKSEIVAEKTAMRDAFCSTLIEMAKKDDRICLLDADLMGAMGTKPFLKEFPDRAIDCGIQEANMVGVAAGLAAQGKIPFAHTFGIFATRRACDQIFVSCAYAGLNVKIVGSDPGVTAALNGGTHMPFEDLGIMRAMPEVTVVEPTDVTMLKDLLPKIVQIPGVAYLRLVRKSCESIYEDGSTFEIGKANVLTEGKDVTIIAMGYCVGQALIAAQQLKSEGISATVIDMFTLKPLDKQAVIDAAKRTGTVVTVENHYVNNGLGSAVAEVLCENCPTPLIRLGSQDKFGEVGSRDFLADKFGINAKAIVQAAKTAVAKKTGNA